MSAHWFLSRAEDISCCQASWCLYWRRCGARHCVLTCHHFTTFRAISVGTKQFCLTVGTSHCVLIHYIFDDAIARAAKKREIIFDRASPHISLVFCMEGEFGQKCHWFVPLRDWFVPLCLSFVYLDAIGSYTSMPFVRTSMPFFRTSGYDIDLYNNVSVR